MATNPADAQIATCEQLIHYEFADKALLARALNASGNRTFFAGEFVLDNKALAVFGDVAMEARLCRQWLATGTPRGRDPSSPWWWLLTRLSGTWDSIRKSVLDNANLARAGFALSLQTCIKVYALTAVSANMMATTVEAIGAAVLLDGGDKALADFMEVFGLTDARLAITTVSVTSSCPPSLPPLMSTLRLLANRLIVPLAS